MSENRGPVLLAVAGVGAVGFWWFLLRDDPDEHRHADSSDPLPTPSGLSATNVTDTGATVTCDAVVGATHYVFSVDGVPLNPVASNSAHLTGLRKGSHVVRVRATAPGRESAESEPYSLVIP